MTLSVKDWAAAVEASARAAAPRETLVNMVLIIWALKRMLDDWLEVLVWALKRILDEWLEVFVWMLDEKR